MTSDTREHKSVEHEIGMTVHCLNSSVGGLFDLATTHPALVTRELEHIETIAHGLASVIAALKERKAA